MIPSLDIANFPWKLIIFIGIFFTIRAYFRGTKCYSNFTIKDKIVLITGANSGIGYELTKNLFQRGAIVIMACRDMEKGQKAIEKILSETKKDRSKLILKKLNLSNISSVKTFAQNLSQEFKEIDVLINNAGIMMHPPSFTDDGIEIHFFVNYLAPFILTMLLLPQIKASKQGRIINVGSLACRIGKINLATIKDIQGNLPEETGDTFGARELFAQSKLAIHLFTKMLAEKLKDSSSVTVNTCYPGICLTNIMRYTPIYENQVLYFLFLPFLWFLTKTANDGAQTLIYCAVEPSLATVTGKFFSECQEKNLDLPEMDTEVLKNLWDTSLKLCDMAVDL